MGRLTEVNKTGAVLLLNNPHDNQEARERLMVAFDKAVKKLANYEQAEEEGRLVILPCKIGDPVYRICGQKGRKYVSEREVNAITLTSKRIFIHSTMEDVLGDTVFTTREEAEAALRRLNG